MSRLFSSFPSVNDLLETPPLKGVVERVGRNRVLTETTRFLDRIRQQAQSAAQQAFHFTTNDLAQRVARWIAASGPNGQRAIINATGVLLPADLIGPPLAIEAIDAMAHAEGTYQSGDQAVVVSALLQKLSGFERASVLPSAPAAMLATFAALAANREVVIRRGELERDPNEVSLDDLARCAIVALREVGSNNETTQSDFEQALGLNAAGILSVTLRYSHAGDAVMPDLTQLSAVAKRRGLPLIADLGWGGIADLSRFGLAGLITARAACDAGADLVVVRGHGTLGGPACGILIGRGDLIEKIEAHPFARSARVTAPVLAALAATLELHESPTRAEQAIPLLSLIATSRENLKLRAERLAPQMNAIPGIAAEPVETHAPLARRRIVGELLPGWGIALKTAAGPPADLAIQLLAASQGIATRVENDRVLLDLRSVPPKHDLSLVDAVTALGAPAPEAAPV